ncbi:protein TolQ [Paracoccus aerodenitrificans]|uniref:protein TolQ n=1 Tax=Paracoccus aerodenitrificans TaxID=3017781 RepID=UPI0022F1356B|nr:protein TolQ [Paracoccus aerodenitrificans]WBU64078.1 protein TolQ [Paracoccus aerodenitrificans]
MEQLDFSLIALFMRASLIVKIVMVLLILASFWSWALIIQKLLKFGAARTEAAKFDRAFWSGEPLDDLYDRMGENPRGAAERIFAAGMGEWRKSQDDAGRMIPGTQQRIDRAMNVAIGREEVRLTRGLSFLATIGSTAPFIGLFGTVWGIKTAFEQIAIAQDTSLAVVAPGIAEALLATALGLLAAIPAVIFYNKFTADADRLGANYENFSDEFSTILSRQLNEG